MGHTRGGGIGNMAGSYDHTRKEVEAELRQRITVGGGYGDITEDELNRLVGKTTLRRGTDLVVDRETLVARLEWLASAKPGDDFPVDLFGPGNWAHAVAAAAQYALDEIADIEMLFDVRLSADMLAIARWRKAAPGRELTLPDHTDLCVWLLDQHRAIEWRPIAEAPIPGPDAVKEYWTFPCLIQTEKGIVGEGFARWVEDGRMKGAREACVLRWYLGAADRGRDTRVCHDPKYFMPLPAKRED